MTRRCSLPRRYCKRKSLLSLRPWEVGCNYRMAPESSVCCRFFANAAGEKGEAGDQQAGCCGLGDGEFLRGDPGGVAGDGRVSEELAEKGADAGCVRGGYFAETVVRGVGDAIDEIVDSDDLEL